MSVASEIPLDVLDVIFASLAPHDLAICARVSRAVSARALDALYRDLRPTQRNVLRLCLKLCNDPGLARRARSLVIHDNAVDMYLGVLSDVLPKLPRLTTLVLNIGPSSAWILPAADACPFRLTTFVCGFVYDTHLAAFLATQPDLLHFSVAALSFPRLLRALAPTFLPRLVSLSAPLAVVDALVPGRPVRDVTTFSHQPPPANAAGAPSITSLARTHAPRGVQRLMLNFRYLQTISCELLATSAPNLARLTIDADGVKPDDEDMLNELTDWIEEYLSYAKDLDCLTIRFFPVLSQIPCQELDFSDMITSIFAASTKLRHVIIVFYAYKAKYVCRRVPGHDWYIVND